TGTLILNQATVTGGTINDFGPHGGGTVNVIAGSTIENATINNGFVTVQAAQLTLDTDTVSATAISDPGGNAGSLLLKHTVILEHGASISGFNSGSNVTNTNKLEIATGGATLSNDVLTNTSAIVQVDDLQTLAIAQTTISGGVVTVHGELEAFAGTSTIKGLASGNFSNAGTIEVVGSATGSGSELAGDVDNDSTGTPLILDNDALTNTVRSVVVPVAELQLLDGASMTGGGGAVAAQGELEAVAGASTIKSVASGNFNNAGTIEVVGSATGSGSVL